MQLLDHVSIAVANLAQARPFYQAVLAALGAVQVYDEPTAIGFGERCSAEQPGHSYLSVFEPAAACATPNTSAGPVHVEPKRHWCFKAQSRAQVDAFYQAGLAHGGRDDGAPGLRPHYHPHYYAAFLIDPSGNRVEAVCHLAQAIDAAALGQPG